MIRFNTGFVFIIMNIYFKKLKHIVEPTCKDFPHCEKLSIGWSF